MSMTSVSCCLKGGITMFDPLTKSIYINGEWKNVIKKQSEEVINPATGEVLTSVSYGGAKETKFAIEAAEQAFHTWGKRTGRERSDFLYKAQALVRQKVEKLAKIITLEQGKPLAEARGEVISSADFLRWYAEEANRAYGKWLPSSITDKRMVAMPQPIGVVGAITPWNFPSSMVARKLAPALAAGCTVVLKPSPETPLSAIEMMKIFAEAGFPKGVVNLVTGNAEEIGQELLQHKGVKMITFTGSTAVGKHLMRESASTVKKVALELGGHAPMVVFEDADLDLATDLALASKLRNNGQTCICTNRLYVHETIQAEFTEQLQEKIARYVIGNGLDEATDLGPLINLKALEKVRDHIADAKSKGAKILYGKKDITAPKEGNFIAPTIVTDIHKEMLLVHEETFGPVLPIQSFSDEDQVIQQANDTDYGLAAYVFTENTSRALRVSEALEYGIVGVNDVFPATPEAPFGGIKQSGIGKEGGYYGMEEFLEQKFVSIGIK